MPIDRRAFLRIAGSSAVVLAAGAGAFAWTRDPSRALAPWAAAGSGYGDPRLRALSYAILAPNPHNRQPWMVDLGSDGALTLHCDPDRLLPETDPFNRQIVIGLGCFLELLRMAAAEDGYRAEISPFPEGAPESHIDGRPVAQVRLRKAPGMNADPLFRQVLDRRSNKEPFDTAKPVPAGVLAALGAAARGPLETGASNAPGRVAALRDLTWRAFVIETETPRTYLESVRLMRLGKAEIEANPDGIDIGGAFPEAMQLLGLLTRETLADPGSQAYAQGLDMYREILGTGMAYIWLISDGNSRHDQLAAGAAWLRLNLKATELGLGVHPVSQALQEYPEMAPLYQELHAMLGAEGGRTVQMLGRLGYGPEVAPSPRWPLETRLKEG
ncbi:MAG: nitroreductase family protein [Alphaproteobacteria bacterium]|nr:nitroreductase family protein [Alphaproteobacteria bacterium]